VQQRGNADILLAEYRKIQSELQKLKNEALGHELKAGIVPRSRPGLIRILLLFGLVGMVVAAALPEQLQTSLSREADWIELLSSLCLVVAAVVVCFLRPFHAWAHISLLAFLLAEREFDARVLSEGSFLRSTVEWIDDGALHNWVVIAVLGFWLIYGLLRYTWPMLWEAISKKSDIAATLGVSALLVVVSQLIEVIAKSHFDIVFSLGTLHIWEELLELYFATSILILAVVGVVRQHTRP
jgi:hypothetical protein